MLFYHKGLRGRKAPLPFVAYARKTVILRGQIWSAHESDVVGLMSVNALTDIRVIGLSHSPTLPCLDTGFDLHGSPPVLQGKTISTLLPALGGKIGIRVFFPEKTLCIEITKG
jgi:hypothetical protein